LYIESLILVDTAHILGSIFRFDQTAYYWVTALAQYALLTTDFETSHFPKLAQIDGRIRG
jgi:hypothetical protein